MPADHPSGQTGQKGRQYRSARPSYEELEAQAAAMREALEGVWAVCSKEHWPAVGAALEPEAGRRVLAELNKARHERDLLREPVRLLAGTLDDHDRRALLARAHLHVLPADDEDTIAVELPLGRLREARDALQAVEATPQRIARMKDALERIASYEQFRAGYEDFEDERRAELRALTRQIPLEARRALTPAGLPDAPLAVVVDKRLQEARRYEEALREIAARAEDYGSAPGPPAHEVSHALMVEMPDIAREALYPREPAGEASGATSEW